MTVYPCAKINLGLNIINKRPDGYHNLQTVFYPIDICDELSVTEVSSAKSIHACEMQIDGMQIEGDIQDNLVVKAYNLLTKQFKLPSVKVKLTKKIPMQAGMGGGSSDCAYMIKALNNMFDLGLQISQMQSLSAKLGADCAFFVNPVPSYAQGIGELLTPIDLTLRNYKIIIVKPMLAVSTREAFSHIVPQKPVECCCDIVKKPIEEWKHLLVNDFEQSVSQNHSKIIDIKSKLYKLGAIYAAMSGSGSALYGIFDDVPKNISKEFEDCFTTVTSGDCDRF